MKSAPASLALYLSLAAVLATFSAASVSLGLLRCITVWERVTSTVVLFGAMMGVAASLIAVAERRITGLENVLIGVGFLGTGSYVIVTALKAIWSEPDPREAKGTPAIFDAQAQVRVVPRSRADTTTRQAILRYVVSSGPSSLHRRPAPRSVLVPLVAGFACALLLLLLANSNVFSYFFRSRPVVDAQVHETERDSPTRAVAYKPYEGCPVTLRIRGVPERQAEELRRLWFGEGSYGAEAAGCPETASSVAGHPGVWIERGTNPADGEEMSLGIAGATGAAMLLGEAAQIGAGLASSGRLVGAQPRVEVGTGDAYILDTAGGAAILIRSTLVGRYVLMPPALTAMWLAVVRSSGWVWPESVGRQGTTTLYALRGENGTVMATARCTRDGACDLDKQGRTYAQATGADLILQEILAYAPATPTGASA